MDFTPDILKDQTRKQEDIKNQTIKHKPVLIDEATYKKEDLLSTVECKTAISKYLAENISTPYNLTLIAN